MFSFVISIISAVIHFFFPAQRYSYVGRLYGHRNSIAIVKATVSIGTNVLLASAGRDGVQLWRLPSMTRIPTPDAQHPRRGTVTALAWATDSRHATDILIFGTSLGFLVVWRRSSVSIGSHDFQEIYSRSLGNGGEIISIDVDMSITETIRFVNCTRDGNVQAWDFDELGQISPVFSVHLDHTIPRASQYGTIQGGKRSVFVLAYEVEQPGNGILVTLNANDGVLINTQDVSKSGEISSASFCEARQIMAIDNGETGFDLCDINRCNVIRHFPLRMNPCNARLPMQVAFAEGAGVVVGGSDHGVAYVFDRRTGDIVDTLYHALDGDSFVQTISTYDTNESTYVFTASSSRSAMPYISVWKYNHEGNAHSPPGLFQSIKSFLHKVFQVIMILSFAAFLSQNLGYYDRIRILVHNLTADTPAQGRTSFTAIDVTLVKATHHGQTPYPNENRESARAYTDEANIPEIMERKVEEIEEDEVCRMLEI